MCGLIAIFGSERSPVRDYEAALEGLRHRGPDDSGSSSIGRTWLGHRRLSIIDLTERGKQPMYSHDGRYAVVYNGEIYNYLELRAELSALGVVFKSETDTEVLLAAWVQWGVECLNRLVGMFAFVMLDTRSGDACIVRDHFGIKPLYYMRNGSQVVVASEPHAVLRAAKRVVPLNRIATFQYLRWGMSPGTHTLFDGISEVPPAHFVRYDAASEALQSPTGYWRLHPGEPTRLSFPDAAAECRERFIENVRLHMRSDVAVGAALSGGIDSSAVVAAMNSLEPDRDVPLFSFIADGPSSEERWCDLMAAQVGGELHKVTIDDNDISEDLLQLVRAHGEPLRSASVYAQYRVFKCAREHGIRVTLDGQGADELLGGYSNLVATYARQTLMAGRPDIAVGLMTANGSGWRQIMELVALTGERLLPAALKTTLRGFLGSAPVGPYLNRDWFGQTDLGEAAGAVLWPQKTLKEHLVHSVRQTLPGLLRHVDRNSMSWSVESRVPFLTPDFAQFIIDLPEDYLISNSGMRKHVFRHAVEGMVPAAILARRDKIGFVANDGRWLRTNHKRFSRHYEVLAQAPFIRADELLKFVDGFIAGHHAEARVVWRLLTFGVWLELFGESLEY